MTRPASPYAALAQTVGVASAPAAYVPPGLSAADHALMEALLVHRRTCGDLRTRELLQLALLELADQPPPTGEVVAVPPRGRP